MGQPQGEDLKIDFDSGLRLEFHGSKATSDAGLLAYRELDETILQELCLQSGEACAFRAGLQSGKLIAKAGSAARNQALDTAHTAKKRVEC